jgi:hypothetical protein
MGINEFKQGLSKIREAKSITGILYHSIYVKDLHIFFKRPQSNKYEKIKIDELYNLYVNVPNINTVAAKEYITSRVQSPAVAIILKLKENDKSFSMV